jgi:hypothetical protein
MVSNVAFVIGDLSTRHLTIPPNFHMFVHSWWPKRLATLCDEGKFMHQCEQLVFHFIGAKCSIHKICLVVTQLEHGLKLHRCKVTYGEWDLNPINFSCILEIEYIRMIANPWLNYTCWVILQAPIPLLCFWTK